MSAVRKPAPAPAPRPHGGSGEVRIIGGRWKRTRLPVPALPGLRPTPDRVRETLFNWLGQALYGQRVLDLFAGSGALGFEAASRGASRVVMVEKSRAVAASLHDNRRLLEAGTVEVVNADAIGWLSGCTDTFDLILVDPPYDSDLLARVLPLLAARLAPGGTVYAECRDWPELNGWKRVKEGRAGVVRHGLLIREPA